MLAKRWENKILNRSPNVDRLEQVVLVELRAVVGADGIIMERNQLQTYKYYGQGGSRRSLQCSDISEILCGLPSQAPRYPLPMRVAYHDDCHQGRVAAGLAFAISHISARWTISLISTRHR